MLGLFGNGRYFCFTAWEVRQLFKREMAAPPLGSIPLSRMPRARCVLISYLFRSFSSSEKHSLIFALSNGVIYIHFLSTLVLFICIAVISTFLSLIISSDYYYYCCWKPSLSHELSKWPNMAVSWLILPPPVLGIRCSRGEPLVSGVARIKPYMSDCCWRSVESGSVSRQEVSTI